MTENRVGISTNDHGKSHDEVFDHAYGLARGARIDFGTIFFGTVKAEGGHDQTVTVSLIPGPVTDKGQYSTIEIRGHQGVNAVLAREGDTVVHADGVTSEVVHALFSATPDKATMAAQRTLFQKYGPRSARNR